ncbi:MAG: hypothetical protein U1F14_06415 [Steroidobacteraceae bacterium]
MTTRYIVRGITALAAALLLQACGGRSQDEGGSAGEVPESTVLDPMTRAPGRVQRRLDATREGHERALEEQIEASEDAPRPSSGGDE